MDAAYSVLARHPLGSENHVLTHYDFLQWLGATGRAVRVLDEGLQRFPESWVLHDRLRGRALRERGVPGLEAVYEEMLASKGSDPSLEWFAGYASLVAAEFRRREGANAEALAAYERAIAHYERFTAARPEGRASADHYVAVALGGRARIAYEQGDDPRAVGELLASFQRSPDSASTLDGLNLSAVDTAKMVRVRLQGGSQAELLAKLQAGLDALDPRHLELPAYEREVPPAGSERRPPRRQRP